MGKINRKRALVVPLLLSGIGMVALAGQASADSIRVTVVKGGVERCAATWRSDVDKFSIQDSSKDSRYCYVVYDWDSNLSDGSRINKELDKNIGKTQLFSVSVPQGKTVIYWKLCREIPNGPDDCASDRSDVP